MNREKHVTYHYKLKKYYKFLCILSGFLLAACGGSGEDSSSTQTTNPNPFVSYTYTEANSTTFQKEITVDWSYDTASNPDVTGYRIYDSQGSIICSTNDPDLRKLTCNYDFTTQDPTFTMTAYDMNGDESPHSAPLTVNKPPLASIFAGWDDTTVHFDASTSYDFAGGSIISYKWDFGDGNTSANIAVEHDFQPGIYNVTLEVIDNEGVASSTTVVIEIV